MTNHPGIDPIAIAQVDPLHFSLRGSHLIEASAGTGKTWTIAALYVRLVLGHGGQAARLPAQILVLTFTEAATHELRDRIRSRLIQAAACFAGPSVSAEECQDPFLCALRAEYPTAQWAGCARLLDLAAQSMDEAAISTIHGWCNRVLGEHAFDSSQLFHQQLLENLADLTREVAWDYWRACVASLDGRSLDIVLGMWANPDALAAAMSSALTREGLPQVEMDSLQSACRQGMAEQQAQVRVLKAACEATLDDFQAWLESQGGAIKIDARSRGKWLGALRAWVLDDEQIRPALTDTGLAALTPEGLASRWRGEGQVPSWPAGSDVVQTLVAQLPQLSHALRAPVYDHALVWMAQRLQAMLTQRGAMGFDGLLSNLDSALRRAQGEALAQTLRHQFPVVIIDEFQDTDPLQYRIFDRIYRVAEPSPDTALIFIGDPKQAIYGFRGADVQTYLLAAQACAGRVQTLSRNYRSDSLLVQAVNHCFDRHEDGAVFPTARHGESIAFHPVQAEGRAERWFFDGKHPAVLQAAWLTPEDADTLSNTAYRNKAAMLCASQIVQVLRGGAEGQAGFLSAEGLRAVRPSDVAVLVNSRGEAQAVRDALTVQGVRSVYLSDQRSVYASEIAQEIGFILQACAHPQDEAAIRAALATPLLAQSLSQLAQCVDDEWAWDERVEQFQAYAVRWRQAGVLPVLRQVFRDFDVPARLLSLGAAGERQLTDCLHVAELLQQASVQLDSEGALLHYLARQRESAQDAVTEDARRVRLESDDQLVRVVTVHKSKGLEYPLVFLPFVCSGGWPGPKSGPQQLHWGGRRQWLFQLDDAQTQQWALEQLGEEVRKFYVALTRAKFAVWLVLADVDKRSTSGIAHALGDPLKDAWDERCRLYPDQFAWLPDSPQGDEVGQEGWAGISVVSPAQAPGPARRLSRPVLDTPWWIASYSALHWDNAGQAVSWTRPEAPETVTGEILREDFPVHASQPETGDASLALPGFPRGSEAGTFLHGLLEWAGRRNFRQLEGGARDMIARRCAVRGWEAHIDMLYDWLLQFAQTRWLPDLPQAPVLQLNQVQRCLPEMEFWLPVRHLSVQTLDKALTAGTFGAIPRPELEPHLLNGLFKGFIDLTIQVDGRYYLIDYKSNDLGPAWQDYAPDALVKAVCAARYDVQMLMYVLALHRQLRARLPDYDYHRHMGGAVYMFLRGQPSPGQGLISLRPPRVLVDALDALLLGPEPAYD